MVTLTQLEYIVAVDTYRHFATAAEKKFITQPTLSMQIKKMEDELGVIIFDRSKQPIIPTDVGRKIIEQARQILFEANKIPAIIDDFRGEVSGTLKIGIIPTLTPYLLPLFIGEFSKKYPNIDIYVEEYYTHIIEDKLKKDQLDVGIVVTPLKDKNIHEDPLFYEEMKIFSHRSHPIAKKQTVSVEDIASPDIWLLNDGHCFRTQVINLCRMKNQVQSKLPFHFDGGSLETVMKIIEREGGYTLIPELAAGFVSLTAPVIVRNFSDLTPLREVSLIYARNFAKHKLINVLRNEIMQQVPKSLRNKDRGTIVEWR